MPVSKRTELEKSANLATEVSTTEDGLRAYTAHGMDLVIRNGHGIGECPFCGAAGKFSVSVDSGLWRCWVCGGGTEKGGGNPLAFLRLLHKDSMDRSTEEFRSEVCTNRRLCNTDTVTSWGVCQSLIPPYHWLVPGYGIDGQLDQLYKRTHMLIKGEWTWLLLPTPGIWPEGKVHALHLPVSDFDVSRQTVVICEGPWDGMALWEVYNNTNPSARGIPVDNIISVPGCNVWRDEWTKMCTGKDVVLLFDSDHPRELGARAGYDGMQRIGKRLSGYASSVKYVNWGPDGYDPDKLSGWDIRDHITGTSGMPPFMVDRHDNLISLFLKVVAAPADWFIANAHTSNGSIHTTSIEAQPCSKWQDCEAAWQGAMKWRQDMSDALAVMLAVCASTQQAGNQLFLDIVGTPGSGKTTMCKGLLVSHHCHHLEHLTGFHSGWKSDSGKDCSLISRINGKTLVTSEFDIMRTSPRYSELMSQTRRIFDGESGATYKNTEVDTLYVGLRTPWIRAGTPSSIIDSDQSQLGDRFQRLIIGEPEEDEKRAIMRSALRSERMAMLDRANGTAGSIVDSKMRKAQALTGGYVDWLRANVEDRLPGVINNISESAEERCIDLADLCADLRARPNEDKRKKENHDSKELPTRLARQNIRLATHLAVVLNRTVVCNDVMRIVRKVSLDTAHGHSLNIVRWLCSPNVKVKGKLHQECGGLSNTVISAWCNMTPDRMLNYLVFLRKIGVLELRVSKHSGDLWMLTDRVYNLYLRVMGK